jgi:hypothetical protein
VLLAVAVTPATPEALVTAVGLERVALAPEAGGVKMTVTPGTGLPSASLTVAWRGLGNGVLTPTDCGVPAVAVMNA